jgi:hypothetical protein
MFHRGKHWLARSKKSYTFPQMQGVQAKEINENVKNLGVVK